MPRGNRYGEDGAGRAPARRGEQAASTGGRAIHAPRPAHPSHQRRARAVHCPVTSRYHAGTRHGAVRPGGGSRLPVIIALLIAAVAVVLLAVLLIIPTAQRVLGLGQEAQGIEAGVEVQINIPEGSSGDQIAQILSENGIIPDPQDYYAAVKELKADALIKPGNYRFTTLQDPVEVVRQLSDGPNVEGLVLTVPEGLTVEQVASAVESTYGIAASDFLAQAKASLYSADYPFLAEAADDSLEGFLCPKTYSFDHTPSSDEIIRAMLDQYQTEVSAFDFDSARQAIQDRYGIAMSDYDLLKLASIIEREALTHDQRYNVSSTFYNRMAQGMPLQSDATMMYVTGGEVTADDLKQESPYNTYLNNGLPPTPICSPSIDSLNAALEPADTDYLYFFITQDAEYFSETYDEHLQAIEENR